MKEDGNDVECTSFPSHLCNFTKNIKGTTCMHGLSLQNYD